MSCSTALRGLLHLLPAAASALVLSACVDSVTPQQVAVQIRGVAKGPLTVAVTDYRSDVASRAERYYGRYRDLYGIPIVVLDLRMPVAERMGRQLEAGLRSQGAAPQVVTSQRNEEPVLPPGAKQKTLLVHLNDAWIDFAAPITNHESILYFDATAKVIGADGKVQAVASRKIERNFHYNRGDLFSNQAILAIQPEITALVNEGTVRAALSRP